MLECTPLGHIHLHRCINIHKHVYDQNPNHERVTKFLLRLTFQVTIEIPYVFFQALLFVLITYPTIGFYWSISKVLWYMYMMFCTMLYFTYIGMLLVASTPKVQLASILASFCYTMTNLFAGFLVPGPVRQSNSIIFVGIHRFSQAPSLEYL